jgi:hypothetical protein
MDSNDRYGLRYYAYTELLGISGREIPDSRGSPCFHDPSHWARVGYSVFVQPASSIQSRKTCSRVGTEPIQNQLFLANVTKPQRLQSDQSIRKEGRPRLLRVVTIGGTIGISK